MNLFNRLSDLLAFNQTPSAEERTTQLLADMEASMAEARCAAALAIAAERRIGHDLARHRSEADRREHQAVQALAAGNEEAARRASLRKRHHEEIVDRLVVEQTVLRFAVAGVRASLRALEDRLAMARCDQSARLARHQVALSGLELRALGDTPRGRLEEVAEALAALHQELEAEASEALAAR